MQAIQAAVASAVSNTVQELRNTGAVGGGPQQRRGEDLLDRLTKRVDEFNGTHYTDWTSTGTVPGQGRGYEEPGEGLLEQLHEQPVREQPVALEVVRREGEEQG